MINPSTQMKDTLQEVALKLDWNLHSGASENIISSLLTASFNGSKGFREWFCKEVYGKPMQGHFYAAANDKIPSIMKNPQGKRKSKTKKLPSRPDVLIWVRGEESDWNKLDNPDEKVARGSAKKIHVIFVEVKHTSLSGPDKAKYTNFLTSLSAFKHGNAESSNILNSKHKFVIISSHNQKALNGIKLNGGAGEDEKRWCSFTNNPLVKHLTLEKIYKAIKKNHVQWCSKCPVLEVFEYYLALILWELNNGVFTKYWTEIIQYYADANQRRYELKQEIVDNIKSLAEMNFCKMPKSGYKAYNSQKIGILEAIYFNKQGNVAEFHYNSQGRETTQLEICETTNSKPKTIGKIDFDEVMSKPSSSQIETLMKDVVGFF